MFPSPNASPQKRKHSEYHDPDYPGTARPEEEEERPTTSKRAAQERNQPTTKTNTLCKDEIVPSERLAAIISREFQREAVLKQQQLEQIDERLAQARHLLERLRYAVVAEYYRKQELPLTASDASALRQTTLLPSSSSTPAEAESTPQMPLHPSIKKIIGKKPRSYEELLRACPKRAAAQTAQHTIRAKSQAQRREERRLIREQGIVIDHEQQARDAIKQEQQASSLSSALPEVVPKDLLPPPQSPLVGKALNATRLNNKRKHLVVVGNTSKYIGSGGGEDGCGAAGSTVAPSTFHGQQAKLSHKWLVYVQAKEKETQPLESFVKKVRFFLHASYRPNDVVDICAPPFQIARRGWGEFPMRIQLFFHERLQQKPVQLVHQLVLDKTQSGLHTLGAETLVEVWLRSPAAERTANQPATPQIKVEEPKISSPKIETTTNHHPQKQQQHQTVVAVKPHAPVQNSPKPRLISYTQNKEELDDNLFEFLNNIGGTQTAFCGDIEKIRPTVMVSEAEALTHIPALLAPPQQLTMTTTAAAATTTATVCGSPRKLVAAKHVSKVQTMTLTTTSAAAAAATIKLENTLQNVSPVFVGAGASVAPTIKFENTTETSSPVPTAAKVGIFNVALPASVPASTPTSNFKGLHIVTNNNNNNNNNNNINRKTIILQGGKSCIQVASKTNGFTAPLSMQPPKKILQKKLVQLIDADGKIKYLQMLVATNPAAPAITKNAIVLPAASRVIGTPAARNATTSINTVPPTATMRTVNLAANIIAKTNATATTTTPSSGVVTIAAAKPKAPPQSTALMSTAISLSGTIKTPPIQPAMKASTQQQTSPRNVVFQKEGKLYIIDPQQMKLRQQQKKQFSLLKPQVSLLKQQQRPPEQTTSKGTATALSSSLSVGSVVCDHNYAPPQMLKPLVPPTTTAPARPKSPAIFRKPWTPVAGASAPAVHLGMRQTRVAASNAFEQLQQQRQAFEQQFAAASFGEMRTAIEFLLRRLPLVLPPTAEAHATPVSSASFAWCSNTLQEFDALPALKQRACEWLRAKYISSSLHKHNVLQQLATATDEAYWSTREICTFARWHAYTPALKALHNASAVGEKPKQSPQANAPFNALVKSELELQPQLPLLACDTLTMQTRLRACVDDLSQLLQQHEVAASAAQVIDIVGSAEEPAKESTGGNTHSLLSNRPILYLPPPVPLADAAQLVGDICRAQRVRLTGEVVLGGDGDGAAEDDDSVQVVQPLAQTLLAQCLRMFVEKLLRQSLAAKVQHSAITSLSTSVSCSSGGGGAGMLLSLQDVGRVLAQSADFDFLTNCHLGGNVVKSCEGESPVPSKPA